MQIPGPTCRDLEPLLESTYEDEKKAWGVFLRFQPMAQRAIRRGWQDRDSQHLGMQDATELASETLVRLMEKVHHAQGLARPDDCAERDPVAWFFTVIRNKAREVQRSARTGSRRALGEAEALSTPESADKLERLRLEGESGIEELLDLRRRFHHQVERLENADLPPPQKLVWVCTFAPHLLDLALVDAAVDWTYNEGAGTVRNAEDTHRELLRWHEAHGDRPTTADARLHLAWILRSTDTTNPQEWRRRHCVEAARARDVLRQWLNRARTRLEEAP